MERREKPREVDRPRPPQASPPPPRLRPVGDDAGRVIADRVSYTGAELAALGVRRRGAKWEAAIRHPGGKVCTADFPTAGAALSFVQAVARARGEA